MNILLMISKNDKYGAQRIFLDQVSGLHTRGHTVIVVGRGEEGYVPEGVRRAGASYFSSSMKSLRDIFYLRQLMKKFSIQVIHTTLDRADYFGLAASKITGIPVVSTMMVPRYHIGYRFADRVIVLSMMQRDVLLRKGIKPHKISVIRPGIDVERFANPDTAKREAWRKKLDTERFSLIFCHIASLIPRKGHRVSIELASECKKRGENPLLIIIGDPLSGEYYESLLQNISDLGLQQNVVFTGWTSEVPEILSLSHFTLLPSEGEALGIVLMEGMAAGTPVIAREGEGGAEIVDQYKGGFNYRPSERIGRTAEQCLALLSDGSRYHNLRASCRDTARREFGLKPFSNKLVALYEALIENVGV